MLVFKMVEWQIVFCFVFCLFVFYFCVIALSHVIKYMLFHSTTGVVTCVELVLEPSTLERFVMWLVKCLCVCALMSLLVLLCRLVLGH